VYKSVLHNEESDELNEESENITLIDSIVNKDKHLVTFAEVEAILRDPIYIEIENTIAEKAYCKVSNNYFEIKANVAKNDINH